MSDPYQDYDEMDDDVGLAPEDKKHAKNDREEWFKGEKGHTYRGALVYFHTVDVNAVRDFRKKAKKDGTEVTRELVMEAAQKALASRAEELGKAADQLSDVERLGTDQVRFKKVLGHYKEGVGYVLSRLGMDGADGDDVWGRMGDQKKYFTTALFLYPTTREGDIIKSEVATNWKVVPWRIGNKVYTRLLAVADGLRANDLSIANQDLTIKCTNTDFQNFDIDGAGKAVWRKSEKFEQKVLERALKVVGQNGKGLIPFREMSTADLRIKLGMGAGSGEDVSEDDFDGLLDNV